MSKYKADYENGDIVYIKDGELTEVLGVVEWKKQNPMEQVTSTFYPEPIKEDLTKWFKKSIIAE